MVRKLSINPMVSKLSIVVLTMLSVALSVWSYGAASSDSGAGLIHLAGFWLSGNLAAIVGYEVFFE